MTRLVVVTLATASALLGQELSPGTAPPSAARLIYSTFAPGGRVDRPSRIALAPDGSLYILADDAAEASTTFVFATPPFAALSRLAPGGDAAAWTRLIAGTEYSAGLATDADGNACVVGRAGEDFEPTAGALDQGGAGFVAKLNLEGDVVYAARLAAEPLDAAVDAAGRAVIVGRADESFQPTPGALKPVVGPANCGRRGGDFVPCPDAFVLVLDATGSTAEWSTFVGGGRTDFAVAVALDPAGDVYIAGETLSEDFPTSAGAPQREFGGAVMNGPLEFRDGFAVKLRADRRRAAVRDLPRRRRRRFRGRHRRRHDR